MGLIGNESVYELANYYLKTRDYQNARKYLYLLLEEESYAKYALERLVSLEIKEGDYSYARELLQTYALENKNLFSYGLLESVESNYETSKAYYKRCLDSRIADKANLAIARLEMQLGNYKEAEEKLGILQEDGKYLDQLPFEFVLLEIIKKQYETAFARFHEINLDLSCSNQIRTYKQLDIYLKHKLGILDISTMNLKSLNDYLLYRYLTNADNVLLKHISEHKNEEKKGTSGRFFKEINSADLLEEVSAIIKTLNPSYFNMIDKYRFRMDRPIGYHGNELTNDICVETILGTDKILTMYPILLSDEFDKEGNNTSEELRRKREMVK